MQLQVQIRRKLKRNFFGTFLIQSRSILSSEFMVMSRVAPKMLHPSPKPTTFGRGVKSQEAEPVQSQGQFETQSRWSSELATQNERIVDNTRFEELFGIRCLLALTAAQSCTQFCVDGGFNKVMYDFPFWGHRHSGLGPGQEASPERSSCMCVRSK